MLTCIKFSTKVYLFSLMMQMSSSVYAVASCTLGQDYHVQSISARINTKYIIVGLVTHSVDGSEPEPEKVLLDASNEHMVQLLLTSKLNGLMVQVLCDPIDRYRTELVEIYVHK